MSQSKFDQGMSARIKEGRVRVTSLSFTHELARAQQQHVLGLLDEADTLLTEARQVSGETSTSALDTAEAQRQAEARVEAAYLALYHTTQAEQFQRLARGETASAAALTDAFRAASTGLTPSEFEGLGVARTLEVFQDVAAFAQQRLDADHPAAIEALAAMTALRAARDAWSGIKGQTVTASTRLQTARDTVKRLYSAARHFLAGALILESLDEDLSQLLPSVHSIY